MGAGVYAYTDIVSLFGGLNRKMAATRHIVIGVIYGYLHKVGTPKTRICLDPRSCKLVGFFTQFNIPTGAPFFMGEEDKISLRLGPDDLGVPAYRMNKIWNMNRKSDATT